MIKNKASTSYVLINYVIIKSICDSVKRYNRYFIYNNFIPNEHTIIFIKNKTTKKI